MTRALTLLVTATAALAVAAPALAAPPPGAYQEHDFAGGRIFNIAPPGQNGLTTAGDVVAFEASGQRPPHQYDQNDMYANLVYATPGLQEDQILDYYKDASF